MISLDLNNPKILYSLVALLLSLFLIQFILLPFFDSVERLEVEVKKKRQVHSEMVVVANQLEALRSQGQQSKGKQQQTIRSLLPWVERTTAADGLKQNVKQISSVNLQKGDLYRERATLRMERLDMQPLLHFVEKLELGPGIKVIRSDIRRGSEKKPGLTLFIELGRF